MVSSAVMWKIALVIGVFGVVGDEPTCWRHDPVSCCFLVGDFIMPCDDGNQLWPCERDFLFDANAGTWYLSSSGYELLVQPNCPNFVNCTFVDPVDCGSLPGTCVWGPVRTLRCKDCPDPTGPENCP